MLGPSKYHQNLSFVKAINVVGEKMDGNTCKKAIIYLCHFRFKTEFMNEFCNCDLQCSYSTSFEEQSNTC